MYLLNFMTWQRRYSHYRKAIASAIVGAMAIIGQSGKAAVAGEGFHSHQNYIAALQSQPTFDIENPASVLEYVLSQSEDIIIVQPTENYSYFKFTHGGLHWQGNMRLETEAGRSDQLHFAYFIIPAPWHDEDLGQYKAFDKSDGVDVKRIDAHTYRITYGPLQKTFKLNDISNSVIDSKKLGPDQVDMGLAHDESGLRFHLLFDTNVLDFAYILDEQHSTAERIVSFSDEQPDLLVGLRTGFVFKSEPELSRKRLVGVHTANISANNYFDGPFDQLPDGFKGELNIKQAFAMIDAEFAETIDAFGNFIDREGARVVIAPYIQYSTKSDFSDLEPCNRYRQTSVDYRVCMKEFLAL